MDGSQVNDFRNEILRIQVPLDGTKHLIERGYREIGTFQWVRETVRNALESGASRMEFGIEWQAVEGLGVYRRTIADNGCGMNAEELQEFFRSFGGGGKPIGGMHENFGIGAKISLLPWNTFGLAVISWKAGEPSMIWIARDPESGDYGLVEVEAEEANGELRKVSVFKPFDIAGEGVDYEAVKLEWMEDHGTVLVLLGDSPDADTVLGDPNHDESAIKGIVRYLNTRLWEIPDRMDIKVETLRTLNKAQWPASKSEAFGPHPKDGSLPTRTLPLWIRGARAYIAFDSSRERTPTAGKLSESGRVTLSDGTVVNWFLWSGERPSIGSYAFAEGYIAGMYEGELYDVQYHHSHYRSWGIAENAVRKNVWLIVEPPKAMDDRHGVYPTADRNELRLRGGAGSGQKLPWAEWGSEFAEAMPGPILAAIQAARTASGGSLDETYRERLADRFGTRWKINRHVADSSGTTRISLTAVGTRSRPRVARSGVKTQSKASGGTGGTGGERRVGRDGNDVRGRPKQVGGGVPSYVPAHSDDFDDPGMLASWAPTYVGHPEGAVLINLDHPVIDAQIRHWRDCYPPSFADLVKDEVVAVYGEVAVAKVAHSEHLKSVISEATVNETMRSDAALTMSLLGLIAEEALIERRLHGKVGRRRGELAASA